MTLDRVAAAILSGGRAERMGGVPKGLLAVGGRRIVDRQLEVLRAVFGRVLIVANDPGPWADLGVPILADRVAGGGPLAGIDAALGGLVPEEAAVVCVGGDMPFLDARSLALLRDAASDADAVVARVGGLPEPLFARYGRACQPAVRARLATGRLKTADLFDDLRIAWIEEAVLRGIAPDLSFLTNINTPEDLARSG